MVHGSGFTVHGSRFAVRGFRFTVRGPGFTGRGSRFAARFEELVRLGVVHVLGGLIGTIVVLAAAIAAYLALSWLVLYVAGRLFPLAGRRRRD